MGSLNRLEKKDFDRFTSLPNHRYYQHGVGTAVHYLLNIRQFPSKSASAKDFIVGDNGTLNRAPILYNEKFNVSDFVKRACNPSNT